MQVVPLNGPTDYRLDRLQGLDTWLVPNGPEATAKLQRGLLPPDRLSGRGPRQCPDRGARRRRRADAACAQEPQGRRGLLVQAPVRRAARRGRLSRHRPALPHRHHRRHSGHDPRDAQRGGALRHADRRALRASGEAARRRRCRAGGPLPVGRRQLRVRSAPSAASRKCRARIILARGTACTRIDPLAPGLACAQISGELMRMLFAASLLALSGAAFAQTPDAASRQAERDLFEKIVEIPTVDGRAAEFSKLTALLTAEFRKAGITNVVIKDHDNTQTLIARWPAAQAVGQEADPADGAHGRGRGQGRATGRTRRSSSARRTAIISAAARNDNKAALTGIVARAAESEARRVPADPRHHRPVHRRRGNRRQRRPPRRDRMAQPDRRRICAQRRCRRRRSVFKDGRVEGFYMQIAEKTYADYKLVATNRGGHSSRAAPGQCHLRAGRRAEGDRAASLPADDQRRQPRRLSSWSPPRTGASMASWSSKWLADPTDRETADLLEANDPGYTRTRCVATMLSRRARAQCACRRRPKPTSIAASSRA